MTKLLITGGCGFLGSNLAAHALKQGYQLVVFDNLSRLGSHENLKWLKAEGDFDFIHGDIRNANDISRCISYFQPDLVFHLAGQVAMTTSISDPRKDFEINVMGTINLLEAIRLQKINPTIIYSSTNKVYGDLEQFHYLEGAKRYSIPERELGFDENTPLDFRSPYGCSKGSADQYMLDYHRNYHLKTVVFRHSSIFGGRQFSSFDQGWVGWFIACALNAKRDINFKFTISGNGKQVRDILFAEDLISCYFSVANHVNKCVGNAFNIGGGMINSISILELFDYLEKAIEVKLSYDVLPFRASDQKLFVADISKAKKIFGWNPSMNKEDSLDKMIDWVMQNA